MKGKISSIILSAHKAEKQEAREILSNDYNVKDRILRDAELIECLKSISVRQLNSKIIEGKDLTFEESFCGMCYVVASTNLHFFNEVKDILGEAYGVVFSRDNALVIGTAFLKLMADKEVFSGLTYQEVAGLACAAKIDVVIELNLPRVIETCGMGGDRGFSSNGSTKKTINASTLSALVLAGMGIPAAKHGSYSNTSAVGSTESIESFGAKINMISLDKVYEIMKKTNFCFLDAHWSKTIHDLSHLLMMETINHVVGPMSPPISRSTEINKVMGVNEKIHPEVIAKAYVELHRRGKQNNGGIAIVCGLDKVLEDNDVNNYAVIKKHCVLDELSPYSSVISLAYRDQFLGSFIVRPEDFGVTINPSKIKLMNEAGSIHIANIEALSALDDDLTNYLAMNASLGFFVYNHSRKNPLVSNGNLNYDFLRESFRTTVRSIKKGESLAALQSYVLQSSTL